MRQCFEGINVHGLPMLSIPEGESVDYPFLNGRFKDGLAAISNSIAQRLDTPRQVTVAGKTMVLNATNAEGTTNILRKHILLPFSDPLPTRYISVFFST